jgi:extracellular factor (EF) 3-hydroxypalmitic acid methyl ester biosynthesis protein
MISTLGKNTFVIGKNSQGIKFQATSLHLTRYQIVFEIYNIYSVIQLSEVLTEFQIILGEQILYSGRATVSNLVNTGIVLICEATLENSWLNIDFFFTHPKYQIELEFDHFLKEFEKTNTIIPEFKVIIADIYVLLVELRQWLEQIEFQLQTNSPKLQPQLEQETIQKLEKPFLETTYHLFSRFEKITQIIQPELQSIHRIYAQRQLHSLILCSPFMHRIFHKPLGYAGDYEMVRMILGNPFIGSSLFSKMINFFFWKTPPAEAHRNRIQYLIQQIENETYKLSLKKKRIRVFNLGCGPAQEVQHFLSQSSVRDAEFTLVDFNDETLNYVQNLVRALKTQNHFQSDIHFIKKSVTQLLKESFKSNEITTNSYDLIYCAGLFDYLSDKICKQLMNFFYTQLAPNGLLVVTNVHTSNPSKSIMEYFAEWFLIYRNEQQLSALAPDCIKPQQVNVLSDSTGVNIFMEIRKSDHD